MNAKIKTLLKSIQATEDRLNAQTTRLWHLVDPTSNEQEAAYDALAIFDHLNPTDLEVLRNVLDGREN